MKLKSKDLKLSYMLDFEIVHPEGTVVYFIKKADRYGPAEDGFGICKSMVTGVYLDAVHDFDNDAFIPRVKYIIKVGDDRLSNHDTFSEKELYTSAKALKEAINKAIDGAN